MRFRAKLTIAMVLLLSLTYGIGGSLMIAQSFSASIDRERDAAVQTYRMVVDVLDLLGDNASPGTAANTVALVLHKLGSGGSNTAARIRFGAQMTTTGDTALLDAAPEPSDGGDGLTRIVRTGNGRHYLMLGATADGTTVQLAFDVSNIYTVRQTQQRAYHTTFLILVAFGAAVAWVTSYLLTRPLGTLSRASRELARGNLGYRAPVRSRDEVGQLAADFNRMAGQLERNVNRIQETMALQERFMADFSHEMKTPISSIMMSLQLLNDDRLGTLNGEQKQLVESIKDSSDRLLEITGELLNMTQIETGKLKLHPKITKPIELIDYAIKSTRVLAERFCCFVEVDYPEKISKIFVDSEKIAWVITNLLSNAIHHSPERSRIIVGAVQHDKAVEIYVQDFGRGIDPRYHKSIFERYFRVPGTKVQGSGLGLAISKEFVEAHGGTIRLVIPPDAGYSTEFELLLPTVPAKQQ